MSARLKALISNYLRANSTFQSDDPRYFRIRLLNGLLIAGIIFLLIFTLVNFRNDNTVLATVEFVICLGLIFTYIYIRSTGNFEQTADAATVIVIILGSVLFLTGGTEGSGIFWIFSFPGIILFLQGFKRGAVFLSFLFALLIILDILNEAGIVHPVYSTNIRNLFALSFAFNTSFVFIYERLQEKYYEVVTKQKQQVEALLSVNKTEKQRLSLILQSIGDGVLVLDKDRKVIIVNAAASRISGYSQEELLEKDYRKNLEFIYEKNRYPNEDFVRAALERGEVGTMKDHTILMTKDKRELPVADSAAPIKGVHDEIVGCIVVFRDISREREIEKIKDDFISFASHELRTPLTGSSYYIELLADNINKFGTDEQKEFMKEIVTTNKDMVELVNDLLNVSRIETGRKFTFNFSRHDLLETIVFVISELVYLAKKKNVKVIFEKNWPEFIAVYDEDKMKEVFKNLFSNGIKYSNNGGTVNIRLEHDDTKFTVKVSDTGIGIPADQMPHMFEKLFRADNAISAQIEGNGLGMYITKAIVLGHKGKIWIDSVENQGTTVTIEIPIKNSPA